MWPKHGNSSNARVGFDLIFDRNEADDAAGMIPVVQDDDVDHVMGELTNRAEDWSNIQIRHFPDKAAYSD